MLDCLPFPFRSANNRCGCGDSSSASGAMTGGTTEVSRVNEGSFDELACGVWFCSDAGRDVCEDCSVSTAFAGFKLSWRRRCSAGEGSFDATTRQCGLNESWSSAVSIMNTVDSCLQATHAAALRTAIIARCSLSLASRSVLRMAWSDYNIILLR